MFVMEKYSIDSCVRGYHVYRDIWEASVGEQLPCEREGGNGADPFAVAIKRSGAVVGHIPRKISSVCSLFLRRNGVMKVEMTGGSPYSADLPQGGLEIPCIITFEGVEKDVKKVKRLISAALTPAAESLQPDNKRRKTNSVTDRDLDHDMAEWVRCGCHVLTQHDKNVLLPGQYLTYKHINFAHTPLRSQLPTLNGSQSTLYQSRSQGFKSNVNAIQIIHSSGNHWIVATTLRCDPEEVRIFDSLYESLDAETFQVVKRLFNDGKELKITMVAGAPKQQGCTDCGVFAIAVATCLAFGGDPTKMVLYQATIRHQLLKCFDSKQLTVLAIHTTQYNVIPTVIKFVFL